MNILLTNDDGFEAAGLNILLIKLTMEGHKVYTLVPDGNRSAVSQSITLSKPMTVKKSGDNTWKCSGTPSDCVVIGLNSSLAEEKIDAVLSGINCGGNIGTDAIYSGTCAAARQAVLYGVPGVALSLEIPSGFSGDLEDDYEKLALFTVKNLKALSDCSVTKGEKRCFVNVNAMAGTEWKGVKCAEKLSVRDYDDIISMKKTSRLFGEFEAKYYGREPVSTNDEKSDYNAVESGYVSVSRILVEPVASKLPEGVKFSL